MNFAKIFTRSALGIAMAGAVGTANADLTLVSWSEDPLNLSASWLLDSDPGLFSYSNDGTYWDVTSLDGALDQSIVTTYGTLSLDMASIEAEHAYAPHSGETNPGPAFMSVLAADGWTATKTSTLSHGHPDNYTFTLTSNADGTANISLTAVHAVPEPETYAMMMAGLGLMGAIVRRRKSRNSV